MEFRELAWAQQLHRMKLQYGDAAITTERSLPNFPGESLKQVIAASQHPHNLEPLLLTLARQQNAATRARFAEYQGELVLIQKVFSKDKIAEDTQVAVVGTAAVVNAADGICYPCADACVSYEVWLRVEMLSVLATMLSEGLVQSLTPDMGARLVMDLLALHGDTTQHELLRLYAFTTAHTAAKHLHASRPLLLAGDAFVSAAAAALSNALRSPLPAASPLNDPLQLLGVLAAAAQSLYMCVLCGMCGGDYSSSKLDAAESAEGQVLTGLGKAPDMATYVEAGLMPLLSRAIEVALRLLCDRNAACQAAAGTTAAAGGSASAEAAGTAQIPETACTVYAPQAAVSSTTPHAAGSTSTTAEHRGSRAALPSSALAKALAAVKVPGLTFEDNRRLYQAVAFEGPHVQQLARVVIEFGCSMLQLMTVQGGVSALAPSEVLLGTSSTAGASWPALETLQQMAECDDDMLLASTAKQMLSMAGEQEQQGQQGQQRKEQQMALMARVGHRALIHAVFARRCSQCNIPETDGVAHKRCGQCHKTVYCSVACQKQHWKASHKAVCHKVA